MIGAGVGLLLMMVAAASYTLTARFRRYALARQILDVPNARSLHASSVPRGGGVAIALAALGGFACLGLAGALPWREVSGLCAAGGLVAAIGFADDRGHVRRRWRLLIHAAAAAIVIASIGMPSRFVLLSQPVDLGWLGIPLILLCVVWLVNLTNFMDGIDGIAATEAITVSSGGALLYAVTSSPATAWTPPLVLAAASAGFLLWNWPPARIFMGDVGSGFLGLMLAALSLRAGAAAPELIFGWAILLGVFIVDATMTLGRRVLSGERIHEAHRTHAYQHAAIRAGRHQPVTIAVAAINLLWLLPMALLVASRIMDSAAGLAIAYAPLLLAGWRLGAGSRAAGQARGRGNRIE